ncbi:hypothetical protein EDB92DRAFT_1953274 [Lactarius akahatsu]|uniref:Uncharacterized protein n=1 Tax=Lactarius akahatsu TaxID=416441 RepID=A0AAD4Q3J7_9AGAM|nr:hypothetical protein EDB92DRAFT_1953274 [Lactarius akahatsu]
MPEALQTHPQTVYAHFFRQRRGAWYAHLEEAMKAGYNVVLRSLEPEELERG